MSGNYKRNLLLLVFTLALLSCSATPQLPKLSPDAVILAFGDSLTYGSGVDANMTGGQGLLRGFLMLNFMYVQTVEN